ncbi:hypothetical protein Pla8534_28830 [Lignipirellula cremea]|uniref:Uncharacterized protein n=1 Tax=Lignipirellula cremea TaxID=2528010 RepID=A0A518DTA3_9BACT|nr:hypothetical protein Pla8534_28830 [Lignipirellula cremea]
MAAICRRHLPPIRSAGWRAESGIDSRTFRGNNRKGSKSHTSLCFRGRKRFGRKLWVVYFSFFDEGSFHIVTNPSFFLPPKKGPPKYWLANPRGSSRFGWPLCLLSRESRRVKDRIRRIENRETKPPRLCRPKKGATQILARQSPLVVKVWVAPLSENEERCSRSGTMSGETLLLPGCCCGESLPAQVQV